MEKVDELKKNCKYLSKTYNFYYHAPENNDYTIKSYNDILSFNTLEEFWVLDKFIRKDMIENGMFFIMIDPILPIWEDNNNINGGCISWKIERKNAYKYWIDCVGHFLIQKMGTFNNNINGISISPKKNSSIIKLWFNKDIDINNINFPNTFLLINEKIIYKTHLQNIDKDKTKKTNQHYNKKYIHDDFNNISYS